VGVTARRLVGVKLRPESDRPRRPVVTDEVRRGLRSFSSPERAVRRTRLEGGTFRSVVHAVHPLVLMVELIGCRAGVRSPPEEGVSRLAGVLEVSAVSRETLRGALFFGCGIVRP